MEEQNLNKEEKVQTTDNNLPLGVPVKTIALIVILAVIAGILTFIAISPKGKLTQTLNPKTTNVNPADTTLSVLPSQKDAKTGEYSSLVYIDSGKNEVIGVQLEIYYDPKIVSNVNITPLAYFPSATEVLKKIDQPNGRISYALGSSIGESGVKGKGNLAKITYTVSPSAENTSTAFNFLPKTDVNGVGTDLSLLKSTTDGQINIVNTPSAQPTVSK